MKPLFTIHVLVLAVSFLSFAHAVRKVDWGLRCGPYCLNGRPRGGARGPCINGCFAIKCQGKAQLLTFSPAGMTINRRLSGCSAQRQSPCTNQNLRYRNNGNSCDEFPLASTREGGRGSILRCVPGVENSSQGGQFRSYVRQNGVRTGDTFRQAFVLRIGSLPYCPNSQSCVNDGFQFEYSGGTFSNADIQVAASHTDQAGAAFGNVTGGTRMEGTEYPIFMTSGGLYVTFFDDQDAALNSTVWIDGDDGGLHTIESRLSAEEIHELATAPHPEEELATC